MWEHDSTRTTAARTTRTDKQREREEKRREKSNPSLSEEASYMDMPA